MINSEKPSIISSANVLERGRLDISQLLVVLIESHPMWEVYKGCCPLIRGIKTAMFEYVKERMSNRLKDWN